MKSESPPHVFLRHLVNSLHLLAACMSIVKSLSHKPTVDTSLTMHNNQQITQVAQSGCLDNKSDCQAAVDAGCVK